jgi:hypothetical protein
MATTRGNLSIQEVMDTLQKSGATGGSAFDMGQNRMGVEQGVTNTLTQQANPAIAKNKANYLAQIGKIAEMDQKLAGVYGDPTSPLYIERASKRDQAANMGEATNYSAANTQVDLYNQKKKTLEDSISQVLSVYDELTSLTKAKEVQDKKKKKGTGTGTTGDAYTTEEKPTNTPSDKGRVWQSPTGQWIYDPSIGDWITAAQYWKKKKTIDAAAIKAAGKAGGSSGSLY